MPEKFIGVEVVRNFTWNYRCEHCGKTVEQQDSMAHKAGSTVRKGELSGTQFTLTDEGQAQYRARAHAEAPGMFENTLKAWNNGRFPEWLKKKGVCPHCHKPQHWTGKYEPEWVAGQIIGFVFAVPLFAGLPLWGILSLITKNGRISLAAAGILCVALVVFLAVAALKEEPRKRKELQELEQKGFTFPVFVAWGAETENTRTWA